MHRYCCTTYELSSLIWLAGCYRALTPEGVSAIIVEGKMRYSLDARAFRITGRKVIDMGSIGG